MLRAQRMMVLPQIIRWASFFAYTVLVSFTAVSSLLAIGQALGWHPVPEWNQVHQAGLLFNTTTQGAAIALSVITLLTYRLYWPLPIFLPGLYLAHSRGAVAAIAFGLLATWFRRPLWLLVLTLALGVALSLHPSSSDTQRLAIWYAAATHLTFWGNGFGSFWYLWIANPAWWPQYVHNDYLQTVFELGVWSVIPFGVIGWAVFRTHAIDWPILVTFLFIACFSMPLHMPLIAAFGGAALLSTLGANDA